MDPDQLISGFEKNLIIFPIIPEYKYLVSHTVSLNTG